MCFSMEWLAHLLSILSVVVIAIIAIAVKSSSSFVLAKITPSGMFTDAIWHHFSSNQIPMQAIIIVAVIYFVFLSRLPDLWGMAGGLSLSPHHG